MKPNDVREYYGQKSREEILDFYRTIDIDAVDEFNYDESLFHIAATYADDEAIDILTGRGGRANVQRRYGDTPLHSLAELGFRNRYELAEGAVARTAEKLLAAKVSPLRKNDEGQSCLHVAARWGNYRFFEALAAHGAKLDMTDKDGATPLHILCYWAPSAYESIAHAERQLEARRKNATESDHPLYKEQLLHAEASLQKEQAKAEGYFLAVKALVDAGIDVDEKNGYGKTALDILIDRGGAKRIAALLTGAYSDSDDPGDQLRMQTGGMTIHWAIAKGDHEALHAHLALNCDPNAISDDPNHYTGLTPLAVALIHSDALAVEILMEKGADPNCKNAQGETALRALFSVDASIRLNHRVFEERRIERSLASMKKHGLDINAAIDDKGTSALLWACRAMDSSRGYNDHSTPKSVLDVFLAWGCDVNMPDYNGLTPLMALCQCRSHSCENFLITLLEEGADITARDKTGRTPLMYAADNSDRALAKTFADLLFTFGDPLPDAVDDDGNTALAIATERDNEPLVKYLLGKM